MDYQFQEGLFAYLSSDSGLSDLGVTVTEEIPQGVDGNPAAGFPRVTIGEFDIRDAGTTSTDLFDVMLRLHTFTTASRFETRRIQSRLFEILHRGSFPVEGYGIILIRRESSEIQTDPDRFEHGVCAFRVLIEPR